MFTVQFMKLFTPRGCRVRRELETSHERARCHQMSLVRTKSSRKSGRDLSCAAHPGIWRTYCAHILNGAQLIVRRARSINKLQGEAAACRYNVQWCKYSANHCENLFASSIKGMIRSWDPDRREGKESPGGRKQQFENSLLLSLLKHAITGQYTGSMIGKGVCFSSCRLSRM